MSLTTDRATAELWHYCHRFRPIVDALWKN